MQGSVTRKSFYSFPIARARARALKTVHLFKKKCFVRYGIRAGVYNGMQQNKVYIASARYFTCHVVKGMIIFVTKDNCNTYGKNNTPGKKYQALSYSENQLI